MSPKRSLDWRYVCALNLGASWRTSPNDLLLTVPSLQMTPSDVNYDTLVFLYNLTSQVVYKRWFGMFPGKFVSEVHLSPPNAAYADIGSPHGTIVGIYSKLNMRSALLDRFTCLLGSVAFQARYF